MELQSFTLKLGELKEYEIAKQERLDSKKKNTSEFLETPVQKPLTKVKEYFIKLMIHSFKLI